MADAPIVPVTPTPAGSPAPATPAAPSSAAPAPVLSQPGTPPVVPATPVPAAPAAPKEPTAEEKAEKARQGFQLRQQQREIQAAKDQLAADRKALDEDKELAAKNPNEFFKKHGMSYQELTRRMLTGEDVVSESEQTQQKVVADVESLKKQIADKEAAEQLAQHNRVLEGWRGEVSNFLDKTPDLELCRIDKADSIATIEQIVRLHLNQTGEIMPFAEAATKLEAFLDQRAETYFTKSEKLRKKYGPPVPATPPAEAKPGENGQPVPTPEGKDGGVPAPVKAEGLPASSVPRRTRTLSNDLGGTPGAKAPGKRMAKGAISISDAIAQATAPRPSS